MKQTRRQLGLSEQISLRFHQEMNGVCSVASVIKVGSLFDFMIFKKACHAVFLKHPLLRCVIENHDDIFYFNDKAHFDSIPIKQLNNDDDSRWEKEYSTDILNTFDTSQYCWRITLASDKINKTSHFIIAAIHSICDGKSLAWLLGEILYFYFLIKNNKKIETNSYELPAAMENCFRSKIAKHKTKEQANFVSSPWKLDKPYLKKQHSNKNIYRKLHKSILKNILAQCTQQQVSFTHLFIAAFAISLHKQKKIEHVFDCCLGFDLRGYANPKVENDIFAFYAQPLVLKMEYNCNSTLWQLAKICKQKTQAAIANFQLNDQNNPNLINELIHSWRQSINSGEAFMPPCLSNMGIIDDAFSKTKNHYKIEEYYFTVDQHNTPHGISVFFQTVNETCYFDFNFSAPSTNEQWANQLADNIIMLLSYSN